MATPRQAAAARAALSQTAGTGNAGAGSSPSKQRGGNGLGRKESKKLVDWDDVEAKAKREAMWLLRWRREQQEVEANTPCKSQPPKKRPRKTPPEKRKDDQQTETDQTPPTLGHRRTGSTTKRELEFKAPGSGAVKAELTEEEDAASPTGGGAEAMAGARTAGAQTKTEAENPTESTYDGRCSKDAPSACLPLSLPSPSHSCSSGSDGTAFSTCAPTSLTSAPFPLMPCSPLRHGTPNQQTEITSAGNSDAASWGAAQGICLLAAAAVGRALEEAQVEERQRRGQTPKTERTDWMSALGDKSPAFAPSSGLPPSKRRKGRSTSPKAKARRGGGGKSPKVPGAKSSKCAKSTMGTQRVRAATRDAKPARRRSRKKIPWRPTELRFIVETPSSPSPTGDGPKTSGSSVETPAEGVRTAQRESIVEMGRCADNWRLSVPFLPGFAASRREVGGEDTADGEAKNTYARKGNCDLVVSAGRSARDGTADAPAMDEPATAADGRPKPSSFVSAVDSRSLGGGSSKIDDGAQNEGCGAGVHPLSVTATDDERRNAQASGAASAGDICSTPSHVAVGDDGGGLIWSSLRLSDAGRTSSTDGTIVDTTAKGILGVGKVASTPALGEASTEEMGSDGGNDVRNYDDGYGNDEDHEDDVDDDYYGGDGYDGEEAEGSVDYPHGSIYGRQDAAGWTTGPFSLRWLPADGLAALQAAGAACGMDVDMLEAAAVAAGEAPSERPLEEVLVRGRGRGTKRRVVEVRKVRKKRKTRAKRETHVLISESEGEEPGGTNSTWQELEEAAREEAKALLMYKNCGMFEAEDDENQHWVRRSVRAAGASQLDSPHVVKLLAQIRANDPEVEVLKLHHYLGPDVNTGVIDAVLEALSVNTNCQALYIQNFNEGFRDEQVGKLAAVLRQGKIWCLNAGENYKVSLDTWWDFVEAIKSTNVTHAYLSEHVITPELKNAMRDAIRDNRAKHARHKSYSNFEVIRRCTNMWWNPINSRFLQAELKLMDVDYETISCVPSPVSTGKRLPCSLHGKADGRKSPPSPLKLPDAQPVSPRRSHQKGGGVCSPRRHF